MKEEQLKFSQGIDRPRCQRKGNQPPLDLPLLGNHNICNDYHIMTGWIQPSVLSGRRTLSGSVELSAVRGVYSMYFGHILSRGLYAALRVPLAIVGYFCVLGPQQAMVPVSSAFLPALLELTPGKEPNPAAFAFIGFGCFTCCWSIVLIAAGPWVGGGTLGQLRDRLMVPDQPAGRFATYGSQYYLRVLVLTLIFIALMIGVYIANAIVGSLIMASAHVGEKLDYAEFQKLSRHPANIASGIISGAVLTAIGLVFNLAFAIVASEDDTALGALAKALRFCRKHLGDGLRLFMVYFALNGISWLLYASGGIFGLRSIPVLGAVGIILAVWISFLVVINLGFAISLYLARRAPIAENVSATE